MLKIGDVILYKVDDVVGEVRCQVIKVLGENRYRIRDVYEYIYDRYIFNPNKIE